MQFPATSTLALLAPLLASAAAVPASNQPIGGLIHADRPGSHGNGFYTSAQDDNGVEYFHYHGKAQNTTHSKRAMPGDGLNSDEYVVCNSGGNVDLNDLLDAQDGLEAQFGSGIHIAGGKGKAYVSGPILPRKPLCE